MDAVVERTIEKSTEKARAWEISFEASAPRDRLPIVILKEPYTLFAVSREIAVADAFAAPNQVAPAEAVTPWWRRKTVIPVRGNNTPLVVLYLPSKATMPPDMEERAEVWLAQGTGSLQPAIRAGLRTSRIVWSDNRAVVYAADDQFSDVMDAVIRFTVAVRETSNIEEQMAEIWRAMHAHRGLIRAVTLWDRLTSTDIGKITERVNCMQTRLLRLQTMLKQLDASISSLSKRLCAELIEQAELHNRLETLEAPVEHAWDYYELVNSRLIEAKNAARENLLELLIIFLLAIQMFAGFGLHGNLG
jgi:hypothetical protein